DPVEGHVVLGWYDCRDDMGQGAPFDTDGIANTDTEFYLSFSVDGGASFVKNVIVSGGPSNVTAHPNNPNDVGDFTGIAVQGCIAHPVWADNSNSTGDNPDGTLMQLDVYTATIRLPISGGPGLPGLPDDQFEPNETSDSPKEMGLLVGAQT